MIGKLNFVEISVLGSFEQKKFFLRNGGKELHAAVIKFLEMVFTKFTTNITTE